MIERRQIHISGIVQGVGFRPFVYSLAVSNGLTGFVRNDETGVLMDVEGEAIAIGRVLGLLKTAPPPLAQIDTIECRNHFGSIAHSGMKLKAKYAAFDAELKFAVPGLRIADPKACQCGEILKGVKKPWECKVFGTACTPETPIGSCMVSSEGACAAYYNFGRLSKVAERHSQA